MYFRFCKGANFKRNFLKQHNYLIHARLQFSSIFHPRSFDMKKQIFLREFMFRKARKYFFTLFVFHYCKLALLMMKISIQNQHSFLLSKYKLYNFPHNATCFKNIHCRKSQIILKIRKENQQTVPSTCVVLRTGEEDESRRGVPGVSGHVSALPEANIRVSAEYFFSISILIFDNLHTYSH